MARQDPWNMAEAVILLDATLQYKAGKITRSEAVSTVSDQLRHMALNKGQEIDEIYRNLNGISFQMASMESAWAGYTIMKPATRLFEEAVSLYKTNPAEYRRVLEEAQALNTIASKTNEEQFVEWLSSRISSTQVPEIMALYEEIESFCKKRNVLKKPLFETEDYPTVKAVLDTIESDRLFRFMHKRSMSLYYAAASHYCSYIEERNRNGSPKQFPKAEAIGHTEETETSSAIEYQSGKTESKEPLNHEQNAINNLQADNDSKQPATEPVENDQSTVTATAERTEETPLEEEIKHFLKQASERSLLGVTSRFIESSFPNVSPARIKFTLKTAPWAIMRNNRWRYRETSAVVAQPQEEQKTPSEEAPTEEPPVAESAETNPIPVDTITENEKQISFVSWLEQKGIDRVEAQNIDSDIKRIETWAIRNGIPGINLSSGSRIDCANAASILLRNFKFRELNQREGNILLRAISKFLAYCSDNKGHNAQDKPKEMPIPEKTKEADIKALDTESQNISSGVEASPSSETDNTSQKHTQIDTTAPAASAQEPQDQEGSDVLVVDFSKKESYSFTKPISASYFGKTVYESSWRKLYIRVCKFLFDDYPETFANLRDIARSGDRRYLVYDAEIAKRLAAPAEIADGFFVETNRSASDLLRNLGLLLDSCRVDYDNLVVRYVRSSDKASPETEAIDNTQDTAPAIAVSDKAEAESSSESSLTGSDARDEFRKWLRRQGMANSPADATLWALSKVEEYAAKTGVITGTIYDVTNANELERIWEILNSSTDFISYKKQNSITAYAYKKYCAFRGGRCNQAQSRDIRTVSKATPETTSPAEDRRRRANTDGSSISRKALHAGRAEFEEWLRAANVPAGSIKTYAESVERIGKFMLEKGLEDRNIFSIRGIARLDRIREAFIESKGFTSGKASATYSLDLYALKKYTNFRKNNASEELDEEAERFSSILRDNFENGFRPNSIIDRNRFKQYYTDQYGCEPSQDSDGIVLILRQIGTLQEDRIFYREGSAHSDLLDDIQAEIAQTFKNGASCIYCSELFKRHQEELATQLQVFTQDVLKQLLLSTSYDEYYASKNCFCIRGVKPNADEDIRKLMRQSQTPMEYVDIHRQLWYIPLDTIKYCLATTKDMVNVAQETYFYAPNLPVSASELNRIAELLHGQLSQKSFVTDTELRALIEKDCPSVAINTESFTTWGLRDCLSVLLQNRFAFVGPIISEKGMALNMGQVFAEFSRSHDQMTFDELKEFAKSVNNGFIYWDSVMEVMVRISQNEFVQKGRINFDIDAIDGVLDDLLDGDYAPIKNFGLFLLFPALGVQWNEYVLESYVAGTSRQFSLLHSGYTATECCGGIVRKTSSIKDFQALVTDVLVHSDDWKTRDEALALLVKQGYLQRKHYAKIDVILGQAKLMREQDRAEVTAGI